MARFRQAAPDPEKAARDGVANYVPARRQPDASHTCEDCDRTATWECWFFSEGENDTVHLHVCADHRKEYLITTTDYREKKL